MQEDGADCFAMAFLSFFDCSSTAMELCFTIANLVSSSVFFCSSSLALTSCLAFSSIISLVFKWSLLEQDYFIFIQGVTKVFVLFIVYPVLVKFKKIILSLFLPQLCVLSFNFCNFPSKFRNLSILAANFFLSSAISTKSLAFNSLNESIDCAFDMIDNTCLVH
jgi:hypothetical protein